MVKKSESKCYKPAGEYCRYHNPKPVSAVAAVDTARARVEELFVPKVSYGNVIASLRSVTTNDDLINVYVPEDESQRFGTMNVPVNSRLGAAYLGIVQQAETGQYLNEFKAELSNAYEYIEHEIETLIAARETGTTHSDTALRGLLIKAQILQNAVAISKDASTLVNENRYRITYSTNESNNEVFANNLSSAHAAAEDLVEEYRNDIATGSIIRYQGSRDTALGEIWDNSGTYTSRLTVNGVDWYSPFLTLKR